MRASDDGWPVLGAGREATISIAYRSVKDDFKG